jgi:hypothetical protein
MGRDRLLSELETAPGVAIFAMRLRDFVIKVSFHAAQSFPGTVMGLISPLKQMDSAQDTVRRAGSEMRFRKETFSTCFVAAPMAACVEANSHT